MHSNSPDTITPQGLRLASIRGVRVSEENGLFVLGSIPSLPAVFEVSCADWNVLPKRVLIHENIPVSYFGLWSGRRCLAEFQLGSWFCPPTDPDAQSWLARLMHPLQNIRPIPRLSPAVAEHQQRQVMLMATRGAFPMPSRTSTL